MTKKATMGPEGPRLSPDLPEWAHNEKGEDKDIYVTAKKIITFAGTVHEIGAGCNPCNQLGRICYKWSGAKRCASCVLLKRTIDQCKEKASTIDALAAAVVVCHKSSNPVGTPPSTFKSLLESVNAPYLDQQPQEPLPQKHLKRGRPAARAEIEFSAPMPKRRSINPYRNMSQFERAVRNSAHSEFRASTESHTSSDDEGSYKGTASSEHPAGARGENAVLASTPKGVSTSHRRVTRSGAWRRHPASRGSIAHSDGQTSPARSASPRSVPRRSGRRKTPRGPRAKAPSPPIINETTVVDPSDPLGKPSINIQTVSTTLDPPAVDPDMDIDSPPAPPEDVHMTSTDSHDDPTSAPLPKPIKDASTGGMVFHNAAGVTINVYNTQAIPNVVGLSPGWQDLRTKMLEDFEEFGLSRDAAPLHNTLVKALDMIVAEKLL